MLGVRPEFAEPSAQPSSECASEARRSIPWSARSALLLRVFVPADLQDRDSARDLLRTARPPFPPLSTAFSLVQCISVDFSFVPERWPVSAGRPLPLEKNRRRLIRRPRRLTSCRWQRVSVMKMSSPAAKIAHGQYEPCSRDSFRSDLCSPALSFNRLRHIGGSWRLKQVQGKRASARRR